MLEILALWWLTRRIGRIVAGKGRQSGWYKVLTVVLWFGGEITGAVVGVIVASATSSTEAPIYLFALMGAAVGAGIAYALATNLTPLHPVPQSVLKQNEEVG